MNNVNYNNFKPFKISLWNIKDYKCINNNVNQI